jgi:hypothetical protein
VDFLTNIIRFVLEDVMPLYKELLFVRFSVSVLFSKITGKKKNPTHITTVH